MSVSTIKQVHSGFQTQWGNGSPSDALWAAAQCRAALTNMERAITAPPLQRSREIRNAMQALTAVEETIADWQRVETTELAQARWITIHQRLQAVLNLITGLDVPFSGTGRKPLIQARDILHEILMDGLF